MERKTAPGGLHAQTLNWKLTAEDSIRLDEIMDRIKQASITPTLDIRMDLTACHLNGCKLDLAAMVQGHDSDFFHDVGGIVHHIDRTTGELQDCFIPRFAARGKGVSR